MRDILTLSLPGKTKDLIKEKARKSGFASISNYIQFLIKQDDDLISAAELLKSVKEAQREYETGKAIKARSIKDFV
ncbi:MAG TPA: hypothetical protein VJK25_04025 [Patescibacteria group bacterium]|nr:hypothetical protein [Patescibacteria group bacterium]